MNDNAKKWIEALRSGLYPQTTNYLHTDDGYCCLGVACELYEKEVGGLNPHPVSEDDAFDQELDFHFRYDAIVYDGQTIVLPDKVVEWLGLLNSSGSNKSSSFCLTAENDDGTPFEKIADLIEERHDLFAS